MTPSKTTPKRTNSDFCKLTVKFGSHTANDINSDGNRQQQPLPESKRRKLELARDKSCSPPEAEEVAAASLPTMHDLDETQEKPTYDLRNSETPRCNSANRLRKLVIKCGGKVIDGTANKDAITAANTTGDDSSTGLQQSPLEPTVTPKRRKKNNAEPERVQSHTPWIAASPPPTLHDLEETREKLMHDSKTSVDNTKHEVSSKEDNQKPPEPTPPPVTAAITGGSPNGLKINESIGLQIKESICDGTGVNIWEGRTRRRSCIKKERPPFRFALTESEIEEDFLKMSMDENRPPRKQKPRPTRDLQKQLDDLVPGFHLTEVKADLYKV